jgi:hypothetical protein
VAIAVTLTVLWTMRMPLVTAVAPIRMTAEHAGIAGPRAITIAVAIARSFPFTVSQHR